MNKIIFITITCLVILSISGCRVPQESAGEVNVTVSAGFDAGWNLEYWNLDFGTISRCDVKDSEKFTHGLEVINKGLVPANVWIFTEDTLLVDPDSILSYKAECKAINPVSGNTYAFAGDCWDGLVGAANTYEEIVALSAKQAVRCLNYRSPQALTKPGIRIDLELNVSCQEPAEEKYANFAVVVVEAVPATDCEGDSGYDPGGLKL
jgi:hypothetical protein